ncbi:MAG: endonuclease/exonuclease/phosphatase family protein [Phycisphaerae bacterium]
MKQKQIKSCASMKPYPLCEPPGPVRVMTYNILDGGVGRIDPLCHVIESARPDVVLLCEAIGHGQAMTMARKLKMEIFPAQSLRNPRGAVALLSKLEIIEATNLSAVDERHRHGALEAGIRYGNKVVRIFGTHLGDEPLSEQSRTDEVGAIMECARRYPDDPTIILGDFGIPEAPVSPTGGSGWMAALTADGWVDAQSIEAGAAADTTWPTYQPSVRRDFIFIKSYPGLRITCYQVIRNPLARFAGDHFPVVTELACE